jgi:tetratricopeptide (TPR) repeat protein
MKISSFIKSQLKVSRNDYEGALQILEGELTGTNEDLLCLGMITQYQLWAGNTEKAIGTAKQVLAIDPNNFEMLKMLSLIYAEQENHKDAIEFVKIAIQNYKPEGDPAAPQWMFSTLKLAGKFSSRLKQIEETAREELGDPNKSGREWREWADEYLAWYNEASKTRLQPGQ